jgi:dipeptidase E
MPCYGGSAGAIVLGSHIGTASRDDANDVGLSDLRGLDLFSGSALWCHFRPERDIDAVNHFRAVVPVSVLALPEGSGVTFDSNGIVAIGSGRVATWLDPSAMIPTELRRQG